MYKFLSLVVGIWLAMPAFAQLTESERNGLNDVLTVSNLIPADLRFERKPFHDKYRMDPIDAALDDPVRLADTVMEWHEAGLTQPLPEVLAFICRSMFGEPPIVAKPMVPALADPASKLDPKLKVIVAEIVSAIQASDAEIKAATASLTLAEKREIIEGLPVLAVEEPKVKFSFVKGSVANRDRLLQLLAKVDLAKIRSAAQLLAQRVVAAKSQLQAAKITQLGLIREKVGGLLVEVGGTDDTTFTSSDARLTLDLGGNDTYSGRCGAGVGYSSVLIDLGGDDAFKLGDLSCGAAILGVGIALIDGGDDNFSGQSICFGSGLAGVGVFAKTGGNDTYRAVSLSQGFAIFGIGVCEDSGGDDNYRLKLYGQGASRTQGVGWLIDKAGSDIYEAGGLSMNDPLFSGVSYSNAQGFSSGFREDSGGLSGGIGLLSDGEGRDHYIGDTYLQAASYWFAMGSLYDKSGNDTYTGYHYTQASAMHCCVAYLFDMAGNDTYVTKVGASLAIGHDYGVAFLLDRAGDDIYVSQDSSPGIGVANGLGIFIDADGIDRYDGPPGQGNAARGTGSLGVFVDLGGEDKYRAGIGNGEASWGSNWGVAFDSESKKVETLAPPTKPVVGSIPMPSGQEIEKIYQLATAWGVGQSEATVAENVNKLISIGVPAWDWMLDNHLATSDRLQQRAFVAVGKAVGDAGSAGVGRKALQGSPIEKKNLVAICSEAGLTSLVAVLPRWLDDPDLQLASVKAAGSLKSMESVPGLTKLCLSKDRLLVRACMISLLQIGDESSVGTAQVMLTATDLPTRLAALALVQKFPIQARSIGENMAGDSDDHVARIGIKILGSINTPDVMKTICSYLLDPRPGVRIEALQVLNGRCPAEYIATYSSLINDPVEVVRAVARKCKATKQ